jgi:hypothetical protein
MHQYRVTKYDPVFRDATGAYTKQEWTRFCQIGDSFDGVTLTSSEYLRVESSYIETASLFLAEDHAPDLHAVSLEILADRPNAPAEGSTVADRDFAAACRSVLREEFWCKFEAEGRFVHFGSDYYMYIGVRSRCDKAIEKAEALGLFVEEFDSPYAPDEGDS